MKAGRELDILVAEKVMGWTPEYATDDTGKPYIRIWHGEGAPDIYDICKYNEPETPRFSRLMDDAWQVVEKLTTGGFALELEDGEKVELYFKLTYNWEEGYGCWAYFDWKQTADRHPLYGANAPTAPLAICLAALKALKAEVE